MSDQENTIHLAIAFDKKFLVPFYVLLTSIFSNNRSNRILIHAIATDVTKEEIDKIVSYVRGNHADIRFYQLDKDAVKDFKMPENTHLSLATYYRLFFPELIPSDINKLLYIDTDIVVIGNLAGLYNKDVSHFPIAAAADTFISQNPDARIHSNGKHFNAGVLLINMKEWKEQMITEKAIRFMYENSDKIRWCDQDSLNAVLQNNWLQFGNDFNLTYYDVPADLPRSDFDSFLKGKVIIHYTTEHKPWLALCRNRLRYIYHYYLQMAPISGQPKYIDLKVSNNVMFNFLKIRLKEFLIDRRLIKSL